MNPDEILQKLGIKFEDLNVDERESFTALLQASKQSVLTVEIITQHIRAMKDAVEDELTKNDHNSIKDIFLKARLRNLRLLDIVLSAPERADKQLNQAISGISVTKKNY